MCSKEVLSRRCMNKQGLCGVFVHAARLALVQAVAAWVGVLNVNSYCTRNQGLYGVLRDHPARLALVQAAAGGGGLPAHQPACCIAVIAAWLCAGT